MSNPLKRCRFCDHYDTTKECELCPPESFERWKIANEIEAYVKQSRYYTLEKIRSMIRLNMFCCDQDCKICPFAVNKYCRGTMDLFDFSAMKLGHETELHELLKYKRPGNTNRYERMGE